MQGYVPQSGDIAACYARDWSSRLISLGTYWPLSPTGLRVGPSHVALIAPRRTYGVSELFWYESTTKCPRECLIAGEKVSGVQVHKIEDRISDYVDNGGKVAIYRSRRDLSTEQSFDLEQMLLEQMTARVIYDMGGALSSGTRGLRWLLNQCAACNSDLFCSDQIADLLMEIGKLQRGNSNSYTPGRLLRVLVRQNTYYRLQVIQ